MLFHYAAVTTEFYQYSGLSLSINKFSELSSCRKIVKTNKGGLIDYKRWTLILYDYVAKQHKI